MSPELRDQVKEYFRRMRVPEDRASRVDLVLALLSINSPEALDSAEELTGRPITKCPPAVPLWPPKPISGHPGSRRIVRAAENPSRSASSSYRRIRVGMTKDDALACGIARQDLYRWTRAGYIEWSKSL